MTIERQPPVSNPEALSAPVQTDGGFSDLQALYSGLPPDEMWTIKNKDDYRMSMDTPVDERGLIDVDDLVHMCKTLIRPEYRWPQGLSRHHLYWTEEAYCAFEAAYPNSGAVTFRNLPINIGLMPKQFENVIHFVTRPAPVPDPYVMKMRTEAWRVTRNLFDNARDVVQMERLAESRVRQLAEKPETLRPEFDGEDRIGRAYIDGMFDKYFRSIDRHLQDMEDVPTEFHIVDAAAQPAEVAQHLGKIVGNRSLSLVGQVMRKTA